MTSARIESEPPTPAGPAGQRLRRHRQPPLPNGRTVDQTGISMATLAVDPRVPALVSAIGVLGRHLGHPLESREIPAALARAVAVGRIGVPQQAVRTMLEQRVVVGSGFSADPLTSVARLWRGLQRRANALLDMKRCLTLPGSAAARSGVSRDVLLLSLRLVERGSKRRTKGGDVEAADQWSRARDAAEIALRVAVAEDRKLLLVLPIGRATAAQQLFTDAFERQARLHRMVSPRVIKAGLLSALLTAERNPERLLVASVMPMSDLSATTNEAVGCTGPWPVVTLARDAEFYDMPSGSDGVIEVLPLLLVLHSVLQRTGRGEIAQELLQSVSVTANACVRMREEFGPSLSIPPMDFVQGVIANWGRSPLAATPPERRRPEVAGSIVSGLRLRIETALAPEAARDALSAALAATGIEVASVRSLDSNESSAPAVDVRLRSRLGESSLDDGGAPALIRALGLELRCAAIEPWPQGSAAERPRLRSA